MEPRTSSITGPGVQHGKDRFRALPGCGNRGINLYVVFPERVHQSLLTAHRAGDTVATLSFPLLGDSQRASHAHPQRVRCQQGVLQPGWLIGHQPHIVDDLIEPGTGARSPVRMARLDHPQSQRTGHPFEGRLPVNGHRDPAEPGHHAPVDREEPFALRRQEGVNASYLKGPRPKLLQRRRDARLARTACAVQDNAGCRHPVRMPQNGASTSRRWLLKQHSCQRFLVWLETSSWRLHGFMTSAMPLIWSISASTPSDGARFLRKLGADDRLVCLVAQKDDCPGPAMVVYLACSESSGRRRWT